jgi:hypothetical protein
MIMALHRKTQANAQRLKATEEEQSVPDHAAVSALEISVSDALLRSLKRSKKAGGSRATRCSPMSTSSGSILLQGSPANQSLTMLVAARSNG